jgi:hypothetical protein
MLRTALPPPAPFSANPTGGHITIKKISKRLSEKT